MKYWGICILRGLRPSRGGLTSLAGSKSHFFVGRLDSTWPCASQATLWFPTRDANLLVMGLYSCLVRQNCEDFTSCCAQTTPPQQVRDDYLRVQDSNKPNLEMTRSPTLPGAQPPVRRPSVAWDHHLNAMGSERNCLRHTTKF
jgi:hypothetical protein